MSDEKQFVHLHVHTEYSLLDGLSDIKKIVKRAKDLNMNALAITDHGAMFGVIDFYRAAKAQGVKPIIGMEAYLARRSRFDRDPAHDTKPYHLLLLAKDQTGYKNLMKLASLSQLEGYYYRPRVDRDLLERYSEGLICTSGCLAAEIPRMLEDGREDEARRTIGWYQDVFGRDNFFLELQHHDIPQLHTLNRWLIENQGYARAPLVATNDVHYIRAEDYDAQDTLLCIQTGSVKNQQNRMRMTDPSYHLRSPEEMWRLFGDVPEALTNTLWIAEMCNVDLDSKGYHLPVFPVPEGHTPQSYLRHLCERGAYWRYGDRADDPEVRSRLNYELEVIHDMGFDTYFLIVWDLCEFARHADIWWNVRGSGAGSVAAYCLGITNIDPLSNRLLFERFLNPGRVSMPDIDMDFPEDRRAEMIQYCAQKYGEDKVAAIITFGTMGSKAAIRDVGRALDMPLPEVDRIARLIPSGPKAVSFDDALGDDPEKAIPDLKAVYENDPNARKLIDAARQLEGVTRHASTHAAGIIVADKPLDEYIPLHRVTSGDEEEAPVKQVTQFPMETCESIGLLKVDFLGLSTLTIMRRACELIERYHGVRYDLSNIPYRQDPNDPETTRKVNEMFQMIGRGETIGVFQLESQGMRRMLTDMRPKEFENIVAAVALYRPGPMDYIPTYNRRLHGEEPVTYLHPKMEPIINYTYGIIIYQEQIMQIANELFGYSLGDADMIRKAVSKKKREELLKHRQLFVENGPANGVDADTANRIFDDIEFFARYGFNRSHAADYAVLTCQTAFLKCHYPHEYMAALMSVHRDDSAKVSLFAADCHRMGIAVLPPSVNHSMMDFTIEQQGNGKRAIRFGMGAVKNVGVAPVEHIIERREAGGPFRDLDDFCHRVDMRIVQKRALESLIRVGALDEFGPRHVLLAAVDRILSFSADYHRAKEIGQMSLFGDSTGVSGESILSHLPHVEAVDKREMLRWEKELVGLYVTDHPLRALTEQFANANFNTSVELTEMGEAVNGRLVRVAGLITSVRTLITKKGDTMAILTIEDITGSISAVLFPRTWEKYRSIIAEDSVIVVSGKADTTRGDVQIVVDEVSKTFQAAAPADDLPSPDKLQLDWLDDGDPEGGEHSVDENLGDPEGEPLAVPQAAAAGAPYRSGAAAEPPPVHRDAGMITDREMPGWLADELENGWSPDPGWVYNEDTGHLIGAEEEVNGNTNSTTPAYDAAGRLTPPPAPAARPRDEGAVSNGTPLRRERRAPAKPDPEPESPSGRLLVLYFERTGDLNKDKAKLKRLHGYLVQYPGPDRFCVIFSGGGKKRVRMDFPQQIEINDEVIAFACEKLGERNVEIVEQP